MSELLEQVKKGINTYINLYNPTNKKEGFEDDYSPIRSILWLLLVCFAIYLSWKINGRFDLMHFVFAFCCPPFYIIYVFAITGGRGLF